MSEKSFFKFKEEVFVNNSISSLGVWEVSLINLLFHSYLLDLWSSFEKIFLSFHRTQDDPNVISSVEFIKWYSWQNCSCSPPVTVDSVSVPVLVLVLVLLLDKLLHPASSLSSPRFPLLCVGKLNTSMQYTFLVVVFKNRNQTLSSNSRDILCFVTSRNTIFLSVRFNLAESASRRCWTLSSRIIKERMTR